MLLLVLATCAVASAQDFKSALDQATEYAKAHRYSEVIELLEPFVDIDDPESRYAVAAETGRAFFHLGDYAEADRRFRTAVSLRPRRVETALYLQATSYLIGNREQAYAIFREVLASGATDLYLAVSLPGERAFLADHRVWAILDEMQRPVEVNLDEGSLLDVALGDRRPEVEAALGVPSGAAGDALTARAGPYLTWVFGFNESESLSQIMLHIENLVRYTPYRPRFNPDLDWRSRPQDATAALGAPVSTSAADDDVVVMRWRRDGVAVTMEFARPRRPAPPEVDPRQPALRVVRLERSAQNEETGATRTPLTRAPRE